LGHRIDQGTAVLEHAVDRQVRAAKRATRAGKDSGRRSALRATGIVLVFGLGVAAVVVIARNRRSTDATETPDPFGAALREAEDARRAASASVRA
ncbi:MAG: hypothetical protein ABJC79_12475, partial [Acidimicrobiia bacterium]